MDENKIADAMIVEDAGEPQDNEIDASALADSLTGDAPVEEPAAGNETQAKEDVTQTDAATQTPAQDDGNAAIKRGINELYEDGWTKDDFDALIKDEKVRDDIKAGKDFMRVAAAFERRRNAAPDAQEHAGKRSVPTVRNASTSGVQSRNRIAEMSDKEFAAFSERAVAEAMSGKKVTFR